MKLFGRRDTGAKSRPRVHMEEAAWRDGVMQDVPVGGMSTFGGFGGRSDKLANACWGVGWMSRYELEALRRTSWAAQRVVETVVEDAFARWRAFVAQDASEQLEARMAEAEAAVGAKDALLRAWVAARLHGTACVVMVTAEEDMRAPLVPERVRPGDLRALHVLDHWSMSVPEYDEDWASPTFGEPALWNLTTRFGNRLDVHPSRLLVLYGVEPLTRMGSAVYGNLRGEWAGTSVLEPVLRSINAAEIASSATAHGLADNAMLVVKAPGLADQTVTDPQRAESRTAAMNRGRGNSIMVMDEDDDVRRLASPASGAAPALTALGKRVAWAAGVPEARFLGTPGAGFSSSEPEHLAYSEHVRGLQEKVLAPLLARLDVVLARNAGLPEPVPYEWVPLVTLAESVEAETAALRVGVALQLNDGLATLEEARRWLRESDGFAEALDEDVPEDLEGDGERTDGDGDGDGRGLDGPPDGDGDAGDAEAPDASEEGE